MNDSIYMCVCVFVCTLFNKHVSSNLFTEAFRNYQLSLLFVKFLSIIQEILIRVNED